MRIRQRLTNAVLAAQKHTDTGAPEQGALLHVECDCPVVDPLHWLAAQPLPEKIYWLDRDREEEIAGAGVAHLVGGGEAGQTAGGLWRVRRCIDRARGAVRYYGGVASPGPLDEPWARFGGYRFVAPRFEIRRRGNECRIGVNIPREHVDPAEWVEGLLLDAKVPSAGIPHPESRLDSPGREEWCRIFGEATARITDEVLTKIVLARMTALRFTKALEPPAIMARLRDEAPRCYLFLHQTAPGETFLGASPERLLRRMGQRVETEAVAGTAREDRSGAAATLLASPKERHEHAIVVDHLREKLAQTCTAFSQDPEPSILSLATALHLHTRFEGTCRVGVTEEDLVSSLHPTPATGGMPSERAVELARQLEPFSRGWYAGAIGVLDREYSEFAVGIRSALVQGRHLTLFAGAGIVAGSREQREWDEIERKLLPFLRICGVADEARNR